MKMAVLGWKKNAGWPMSALPVPDEISISALLPTGVYGFMAVCHPFAFVSELPQTDILEEMAQGLSVWQS